MDDTLTHMEMPSPLVSSTASSRPDGQGKTFKHLKNTNISSCEILVPQGVGDGRG